MVITCSSCKYLMQGKIPPLPLTHKELWFLKIPRELADLKDIEECSLAPRTNFTQIHESFIASQQKSSVESTLQLLPRCYEDLGSWKNDSLINTVYGKKLSELTQLKRLSAEIYRVENTEVNFDKFDYICDVILQHHLLDTLGRRPFFPGTSHANTQKKRFPALSFRCLV